MERIERSTSPLPRECSATELHGRPGPDRDARRNPELCKCSVGAGEGNRTLVVSLEGFCSTIELHPHPPPAKNPPHAASGPSPVQLPALPSLTLAEPGGGGRIRTFEGMAGRFTVCSL